MDGISREFVGKSIPAIDHRDVCQHYAPCSAANHTEKIVKVSGEGDGDNLGLVAHLGDEKGNGCRVKTPIGFFEMPVPLFSSLSGIKIQPAITANEATTAQFRTF